MKKQTRVYKALYLLGPVACFVLSSCVTPIQLRKGPAGPAPTTGKKWAKTQHSFLWGLVPSSRIKAYQICARSSWHSIYVSRSFIHILAGILTLGLYVPLSVTLVCQAVPPTPSAEPTAPPDPADEFQEFEETESARPA